MAGRLVAAQAWASSHAKTVDMQTAWVKAMIVDGVGLGAGDCLLNRQRGAARGVVKNDQRIGHTAATHQASNDANLARGLVYTLDVRPNDGWCIARPLLCL